MKGYAPTSIRSAVLVEIAISQGHADQEEARRDRRRRVLELKALGLTNAAISRQLKISRTTVHKDLRSRDETHSGN